MTTAAILALAEGSIFRGIAIGAVGTVCGEVVFNTAMTGYQEILTDPSYARQIVTLTYPQIGNTGIVPLDQESTRVHAAGLVIKELSLLASNWRSTQSLPDYLRAQNTVAIAGIDTRRLTHLLREQGAQKGCILASESLQQRDITTALEQARAFPGLAGMDLAQQVTTDQPFQWQAGVWCAATNRYQSPSHSTWHVVVYDFGVKHTLLRMLATRGCRLTVVPATTPASEVLALQPDGVFLSNGPGDPAACHYAVEAVRAILAKHVPVLGICLGHQLLALASGAQTEKMKFGHHGANHPVHDLTTGAIMITSQNHGFAVAEATLPDCLRATHRSLFDGSLQGIECTDRPALGFQGHPEASPGPHDGQALFDRFMAFLQAK